MPKFDLKRIDAVSGKQQFYQLTIDDNPDYTDTKTEEERNERKNGVLDDFDRELEGKYSKDLAGIYTYMNLVANNEHVPGTKYHELERDKNDPYPDFEFKHGDLRVYGIKITGGKIICLGSYKNKEDKNIRRLRALKKGYFESLKK